MPFRQHLDGYRYLMFIFLKATLFYWHQMTLLSIYRNKVFFSGNSKSDCIALVQAFKVSARCGLGELPHAVRFHALTLPLSKYGQGC